MKKHILFILFAGTFGIMSAQFESEMSEGNRFIQFMHQRGNIKRELPTNFTGSPYLDDNFKSGIVYQNNEVISKDLYLRYNLVSDEIEIKKEFLDPEESIQSLTKAPDIYANIDGALMLYIQDKGEAIEDGYVQVLLLGTNYNLYKKHTVKIFPMKLAKNSFERDVPAHFQANGSYYLSNQAGKIIDLPDSNSKKAKFFGKNEDLEKYIKKNNIDLNDEKDLIRTFRYFDALNDIGFM